MIPNICIYLVSNRLKVPISIYLVHAIAHGVGFAVYLWSTALSVLQIEPTGFDPAIWEASRWSVVDKARNKEWHKFTWWSSSSEQCRHDWGSPSNAHNLHKYVGGARNRNNIKSTKS